MNKLTMKTNRLLCIWITLLCSLFIGRSLLAQQVTVAKSEMNRLSHWIGKWEGEGWQTDQSGQRTTFKVEENVASKLDGLAIFVEGKGKNANGDLGHNAVGLIYYNQEKKSFTFNSMTQEGMSSISELSVKPNGDFVWGFDVPGGKVQFTITVTKDTWIEKGAYGDGNNWYPFMEMNLKRVN